LPDNEKSAFFIHKKNRKNQIIIVKYFKVNYE